LCLGSKIGEKVKSWILANLCGELLQMHPKCGVKSLVEKELILVGFWLSQVWWLGLDFVTW